MESYVPCSSINFIYNLYFLFENTFNTNNNNVFSIIFYSVFVMFISSYHKALINFYLSAHAFYI